MYWTNEDDKRNRLARAKGKRMATERNKAAPVTNTAKTPTEVLTAELRDCCNGYVGAPALAVQCVSALRVAGWMIVREDAIRNAQREAVAAAREDIGVADYYRSAA